MKRILTLVILLISGRLYAQITETNLLTKTPLQYQKTEWDIRLISSWQNPYLQEDAALDMRIIAPSGKKLTLPCYYESGESGATSLWKARFTPQEAGKYTCSFEFSKAGKVIYTSKTQKFSSKASGKDGILHMAGNWIFKFDSGKPFRGIGENLAWESRDRDDSKFFEGLHENPKYNYDYMVPALASHGGNFFRTWICSWNLPIDWKNGFNSKRYTSTEKYYNPSAIERMDHLIELCDSLGVHIMLTLGPGAYHQREGGFARSAGDFFVNPQSKTRYKNRLRYIIARWGYSPAIGAWEFFNEVDNVQFSDKNNPISPESIVAWHDEMSAYLKHTDPYGHPATTSISHREIKGLNSLPNIDFNQKHIYKNTKGIPEAIVKYENEFHKPYVIGEYSYEWDWSKNFDDFAPQMDSDFKRGLWYGLFSPTPILPLSWWWEYFDNRGTDAYLSRVKEISGEMLEAGKGSFSPLRVSATDSAEVMGVRCGRKIFIYAYNPSRSVKNIMISFPESEKNSWQYTPFDCESGKRLATVTTVEADGNLLRIPGISLSGESDMVLIVEKK